MNPTIAYAIVEAFQEEREEDFLVVADMLEEAGNAPRAMRFRLGNFSVIDFNEAISLLYGPLITQLVDLTIAVAQGKMRPAKIFDYFERIAHLKALLTWIRKNDQFKGIHHLLKLFEDAEHFDQEFGETARKKMIQSIRIGGIWSLSVVMADKIVRLESYGKWKEARKWKHFAKQQRAEYYVDNYVRQATGRSVCKYFK